MKKHILLTLLFFTSALTFCSVTPSEVKALKEKGSLAFNDSIYTVSSNYFLRYRDKIKPVNPQFAEATILLVRSLVQEKRHTEASTILKDYSSRLLKLDKKNLQQELDYWTGYIALTQNDFIDSEEIFRKIIADAVEVNLRIKALMSLAESAFIQKKYSTAKEYYLKLVSKYERSAEGQNASCELVKLFLLEQDFFWAEREIKRMSTFNSEIVQNNVNALNILMYTLKGDEKMALTLFNKLMGSNTSGRNANIYLASFSLGELLETKKLHKEAAAVYTRSLIFATTSPQTEQAMLKSASALIKASDVNGAIAVLAEFTTTFSNSKRLADVLFTLGGLYKENKKYKMALTYYQSVVEMDKQTNELKFESQMQIANCYILSDNSDKAIAAFLEAKKLAEKNSDKAKSTFLAAEEAYRIKDFVQAAKYYQQIADEYKKSTFAENARFYQGLAFVKEKQYESASNAFHIFLKEFPTSKLLPAVLFQHAIALKKQQKYAEAISFFNKFTKGHPDSRNVLQAILLQSECLTASNELSEAVALLQNALVKYPGEEMHPYVFSRLINLRFITGESVEGIALAEEFMKKYGNTELAPEVYCRLADFYTNSEKFEKAAQYYSKLANNFPKDKRAPQSLLDAAIATAKFSPEQAIKQLTAINDHKTLSDLIKAEAAFTHGSILAKQAKYKEAVPIFEMIPAYKEISLDLVQKAAGRKADCLYLDNQPAKAAAIYGALLKNETLLPELGDQVRFKLAEALIALKKPDDAIAILHDIIYQHSVEVRNGMLRDWKYFTRAAFKLADSYVLKSEYEKAIKVLSRITELNLPISPEAKDRINTLYKKMEIISTTEDK